MRIARYLTLVLALAALAAFAPSAFAIYNLAGAGDGATGQGGNGLDTATGSMGGWSNTTATVTNRPYIAYLGITNPGSAEVPVIDNRVAAAASPNVLQIGGLGAPYSDIYAFVAPTNSCKVGQAPQDGVCYANPNRVSVYLSAELSSANWSNDMTSTTTLPNVTSNSTVHLIIGFRGPYSSLRWSWVDGIPSYWKNSVIPGVGGTVEVKFTPKTMPVMNSGGCSQIPVSNCDITKADSEKLQPQIILSMDNTLDVGLTGVLFGSTSAFIGSLESSPIVAGQAPTLTYGIAAPHQNADGTDRRGTFYALVPSNILTLFGTSVDAFDQNILSVARTNDAGSFSIGWSAWNATDNGTAGQLLTISDISFSAPKFTVNRASSGSTATSGNSNSSATGSSNNRSNKVRVGSTTALTRILALLNLRTAAGSKTSAKTSTPKVCTATKTGIRAIATGTCRGTITVKPKKGKATKKSFTLVVTKTGKRLPVTLHR